MEFDRFKIATYRYPSQLKERKGVIYYIHDVGDYGKRHAYVAKPFADQGYDFITFD